MPLCVKLLFLFKIFDSGLKHIHIIHAVDVFVKTFSDSFAVSHLAEDSAVRRRDAFYRAKRSVRIITNIRKTILSSGLISRDWPISAAVSL